MLIDTQGRRQRLTLVLFGLLATVIISGTLYVCAFLWWFQLEAILTFVCAPVSIFFLISLWADKKFKTKIKRFSITSLVILCICLLLFGPTKKRLIEKSELKGKAIQTALMEYKNQFGNYPTSLEDPFFSDLNKYALPFRQFHYQTYLDKQGVTSFDLYYFSFDGYIGHLFKDTDKWIYVD